MSELFAMAENKCSAARMTVVASLAAEVEAIKSREAAKGNLYSGHTAKCVVSSCSHALTEFGPVVASHFEWAIQQSLLLGQSKVPGVTTAATAHIALLHEACIAHVRREVAFVGAVNALPQCLSELGVKYTSAVEALSLSLQSRFAEKRRGLVRSLLSQVGGLVSKLTSLRP